MLLQLLLISLISAPTLGQISNAKKLSAVPKQHRSRLVARLNLYVQLERDQRYEQLFELLSDAYKSNQELSRTWYLQTRQPGSYASKNILLEFNVRRVEKSIGVEAPDVYDIVGHAKYNHGGKTVEEERLLEARLQNGDWYFSDWLIRLDD